MATISFAKNASNNLAMSATLQVSDVVASGSTFTIPAISGTITNYGWNTAKYDLRGYHFYSIISSTLYINGVQMPDGFIATNHNAINLPSSSQWASKSWTAISSATSANTSNYFNSNNPTSRTLPITMSAGSWRISAGNSYDPINGNGSMASSGSATLTLDAPPYFNSTPSISKNTDGYYKNVTTVTVSSSATAQYGGYISSTQLTIGSQTASISGNGSIQILLNSVGTFTPVVTITDSRGQVTTVNLSQITVADGTPTTFSSTQPVSDKDGFWTNKSTASVTISNLTVPYSGTATVKFTIGNQSVTRTNDGVLSIVPATSGTFTPTVSVTDSFGRVYTKTLDAITINPYVVPNIRFQLYRAKNITEGGVTKYGIKDDEATTNVLVESEITYISQIGNLTEPTVMIDGSTVSAITWYETYSNTNGLSDEVDWNDYNPTSPVTLYALIDGTFPQANSYIIGIVCHDSVGGNSIEIQQTLSPAFFTIDFLAGGHGIALGKPADQEGFYCAMDANFKDFSGVMRSMFNIFYPKGSYYETHLTNEIPSGSVVPTAADLAALGDTWFDPNYVWGGTWILETAGQVHVSAGTGYGVNGANTNTSDGGEKTHLLTGAESGVKSHTHTINHGHGFTQPTVNGGNHKHLQKSYVNRASYGSGSVNARFTQENNTTYTEFDGGHTHSVSGGAVTDHAGSSGGTTETNATTAHNNMQPYINVYRWHRTA